MTAGAAPPLARPRGSSRQGLAAIVVMLSRISTMIAVLFGLSIIPLLSGRDIALSVYRSRYSEGEVTDEALQAIGREIGLEAGPVGLFGAWLARTIRGDFGVSWVSREPVLPSLMSALGTSLTLMVVAFLIAVVVAGLVIVPTIRRGLDGRPARTGGGGAAALTALPEFLLASLLLIVFSAWLGWFPAFGWRGPWYTVLPALAIGLPTGGFLGRLLADGLAGTFRERWIATWQVAGYSRLRIVGAAVRRTLPGIAAPVALALVATTASAVVIEQVYAIPGIGRATLEAARAQDLPTLQGGILLLMLLAVALGLLVNVMRLSLLGPALRAHTVPTPAPPPPSTRRSLVLPAVMLLALVLVVAAGLPRDPYALENTRLQPPSWELPFGADSSGRDLLARVAHGATATIGTGVVVTGACLLIGLMVGLFPRVAAGPIEITNAAPPVLAGLVVAAVIGPSALGAAVAVTAVSWAPLASHTASLISEAKAQPHVAMAPLLGVGRARVLFHYALPTALGPVFRHACLRLPGICLSLAALGFLGLGPQPPSPDWGLVLSSGLPYVERAPLLVLLPAAALVMLGVFTVSLSSVTLRRRTAPTPPPASELDARQKENENA